MLHSVSWLVSKTQYQSRLIFLIGAFRFASIYKLRHSRMFRSFSDVYTLKSVWRKKYVQRFFRFFSQFDQCSQYFQPENVTESCIRFRIKITRKGLKKFFFAEVQQFCERFRCNETKNFTTIIPILQHLLNYRQVKSSVHCLQSKLSHHRLWCLKSQSRIPDRFPL